MLRAHTQDSARGPIHWCDKGNPLQPAQSSDPMINESWWPEPEPVSGSEVEVGSCCLCETSHSTGGRSLPSRPPGCSHRRPRNHYQGEGIISVNLRPTNNNQMQSTSNQAFLTAGPQAGITLCNFHCKTQGLTRDLGGVE